MSTPPPPSSPDWNIIPHSRRCAQPWSNMRSPMRSLHPVIATQWLVLSMPHPLRPHTRLNPPKTNSLDSNSTPDQHTDQRTGRRHLRHPFAAAAGTCPGAEVLAGSTCPVADLAGHTGPGVVRSPGLVAGRGWASRTGWAAVGCSSPGVASDPAMDPRRRLAEVAEDVGKKAVRPGTMSANVYLRSSNERWVWRSIAFGMRRNAPATRKRDTYVFLRHGDGTGDGKVRRRSDGRLSRRKASGCSRMVCRAWRGVGRAIR
jgi:hypothetical protein